MTPKIYTSPSPSYTEQPCYQTQTATSSKAEPRTVRCTICRKRTHKDNILARIETSRMKILMCSPVCCAGLVLGVSQGLHETERDGTPDGGASPNEDSSPETSDDDLGSGIWVSSKKDKLCSDSDSDDGGLMTVPLRPPSPKVPVRPPSPKVPVRPPSPVVPLRPPSPNVGLSRGGSPRLVVLDDRQADRFPCLLTPLIIFKRCIFSKIFDRT